MPTQVYAARMPARWCRWVRATVRKGARWLRDALARNRIVKWTTGLSITVSEEPGVRALENLVHSEPHDVPIGPDYL